MSLKHTFLVLFLTLPSPIFTHPNTNTNLIDLGYAKHIPTYTNLTKTNASLLNYNNIRYASPPLGPLRFRKPLTPPPYQPLIQDGNISSWKTDCLSSSPLGSPFPLLNGSTWGSEDCLFLNVVVPSGVKEGDKVPVLHWVVGSAYAFGGKDWTGLGLTTNGLFNSPLGLTNKFIIVTHNYRLGVPGFLPKFSSNMNGNLGVWDTLAALEWTKRYISKFGGDPDNITAIGQSAGAGILTWLLLAQEGNLDLPFGQAWMASPSLAPRGRLERSRPVWDLVMNYTKCGNVECLRELGEDKIKRLNSYMLVENVPGPGGGSVGAAPGFTPTVDGELVFELPIKAFEMRKFNNRIKRVVVGHTALEGLGLSSDRSMPERFPEIVRANIPNATNSSIERLLSLYPFSPELPQTLAWQYTTDVVWSCTVGYIADAYKDRTRRFVFSVPPGTHGLDLSYFFYDKNETTPIVSTDLAYASQHVLLQFMFGKELAVSENATLAIPIGLWKEFERNETIANITLGGFGIQPLDELTKRRCDYIYELIRDPANGV
ncbi:lipase [Dendryphion nanum]|uniref:Lipase n=1 Tax=Dendryphion nanum TaxID=256645 RepID=A0A9P9E386_9PLEO|nr:lipase [Dendryphion nanum]